LRIVSLLWLNDRREVREFYRHEDLLSLDWLYALSDDDPRLLRAIIIDARPLDDDDYWGGSSLFVSDVIMFRGYSVYPACWYPEPAQNEPTEDAAAPAVKPKKGKKR
jgi:hypothetical protein